MLKVHEPAYSICTCLGEEAATDDVADSFDEEGGEESEAEDDPELPFEVPEDSTPRAICEASCLQHQTRIGRTSL